MKTEFDLFFNAYVDAALWSSTGDDDEPLDNGEHDLAEETRQRMRADCEAFYAAHSHLFTDENCLYGGCGPTEYAGHDFWLTRAGHGCGYWDGDWAEPAATILTEAAKAVGERVLYVGDDGLIYIV